MTSRDDLYAAAPGVTSFFDLASYCESPTNNTDIAALGDKTGERQFLERLSTWMCTWTVTRRLSAYMWAACDRMSREEQMLLSLLWGDTSGPPLTALWALIVLPLFVDDNMTAPRGAALLGAIMCSWRHFALSIALAAATPVAMGVLTILMLMAL